MSKKSKINTRKQARKKTVPKKKEFVICRVVWQLAADVTGSIDTPNIPSKSELIGINRKLCGRTRLLTDAAAVFRQHPLTLRAACRDSAGKGQKKSRVDLSTFYHVFVESRDRARRLVDRLIRDPEVVYADVQERFELPVIFRTSSNDEEPLAFQPVTLDAPLTPDLSARQVYLAPAPNGVDAQFAWTRLGGRGDGIQVVDIEYGWNFNHEDLRTKRIGTGLVSGPLRDHDHGTCALGVFSGDNTGFGITGIASDALAGGAAASFDFSSDRWNAAAPIYEVTERLNPGDVLLVELQSRGPNGRFIAIEYWEPEFQAIRFATQKGVHVVEAAGNGNDNLSSAVYQNRFSRNLRDSGAILVGAGGSALSDHARSRLAESNYGSRIDLHGWGEDVVTSGGRQVSEYHNLIDHEDPSRCYTKSFGGTSSAAAIIAGVVACISGAVKAAGRSPLAPKDLRSLLTRTGTPQQSAPNRPKSQSIGPLPDLRAALQELGL